MAPPPDWSDWQKWQWKQQWDDGHDKVGALETKLEALETRFSNTWALSQSKCEKQERDHQ